MPSRNSSLVMALVTNAAIGSLCEHLALVIDHTDCGRATPLFFSLYHLIIWLVPSRGSAVCYRMPVFPGCQSVIVAQPLSHWGAVAEATGLEPATSRFVAGRSSPTELLFQFGKEAGVKPAGACTLASRPTSIKPRSLPKVLRAAQANLELPHSQQP